MISLILLICWPCEFGDCDSDCCDCCSCCCLGRMNRVTTSTELTQGNMDSASMSSGVALRMESAFKSRLLVRILCHDWTMGRMCRWIHASLDTWHASEFMSPSVSLLSPDSRSHMLDVVVVVVVVDFVGDDDDDDNCSCSNCLSCLCHMCCESRGDTLGLWSNMCCWVCCVCCCDVGGMDGDDAVVVVVVVVVVIEMLITARNNTRRNDDMVDSIVIIIIYVM